jgi:hypothetical protein
MESDKDQEDIVISDPNEWVYFNQGGHHLAFSGLQKWRGFVLKAKKTSKKIAKPMKDSETKQHTIDEDKVDPLVEYVSKSDKLGKFVPHTVRFVQKAKSKSGSVKEKGIL